MIAIQYDKIEIVNYLLDFDTIGFDHVNDKGVTALLLACSGDQVDNFYITGENNAILYCVLMYCSVLYCTVLYCIVLYCIVLYCIVLYCIVSFRLLSNHIES